MDPIWQAVSSNNSATNKCAQVTTHCFVKVAQCCICALKQPRDAETLVCLKWSSQHGIWWWFPLCRPSNNLHHWHLLTASEGNKCPYWTKLCVFLRGMFKNSAAPDFWLALAKNISLLNFTYSQVNCPEYFKCRKWNSFNQKTVLNFQNYLIFLSSFFFRKHFYFPFWPNQSLYVL